MAFQLQADAMFCEFMLRPYFPVREGDKPTSTTLEGANIGLKIREHMDSGFVSLTLRRRLAITYFQSLRVFILVKVCLHMEH